MSNNYDGKVVVDSLGRSITLRKPNTMNRYNLMRLLGKDSQVEACVNMMIPLLYVAKIEDKDGKCNVFSNPTSYQECCFNLEKLGDEGQEAVISELIDSKISEEEAVEATKK